MEKMPYIRKKLVNLVNSWEEKQVSPKVFGKLLADRFRINKADVTRLIDDLESLGVLVRKPKSILLGRNLNDKRNRPSKDTCNMQKMRERRS